MSSQFKAPYDQETYPGGLSYLRRKYSTRLFPFQGAAEALPPADCDFGPLKSAATVGMTGPMPPAQTIERKSYNLTREFDGAPELCCLHALIIAISRHDDPPEAAITLFRRMWHEEAEFLDENLSTRWKVSALKTFADYGETEQDRRAAAMLAVYVSQMQIYESERTWSGLRPIALFDWKSRVKQRRVALDLAPYPLKSGDSERNLLMWVWNECDAATPGLKALAESLLTLINRDRRTVIRRIDRHKRNMGITP